MSIRIVTDSTCDLPQSVVERYNIAVVPLFINFPDQGYLDGVEMSREEFYRRLPGSNPLPTTATPNPEMFRQTYGRLVEQGATEILSIHMSISLTATVTTARRCAKDFPTVTVLDSRQLSLGTGFLVMRAAQMAAEGRSMREILAALQDQIKRTHVFAALDTLEFLKRSGRMNAAIAGLGTLLQVKPLLRMYDGKPTIERVRTSSGATRRMIEILTELAPFDQAAVVHTHAPGRAEYMSHQVRHLLPAGHTLAMDITPAIGAHIGPNAVGFAVVTSDRKRQTADR
jgi:DegV family protein with EDD domain